MIDLKGFLKNKWRSKGAYRVSPDGNWEFLDTPFSSLGKKEWQQRQKAQANESEQRIKQQRAGAERRIEEAMSSNMGVTCAAVLHALLNITYSNEDKECVLLEIGCKGSVQPVHTIHTHMHACAHAYTQCLHTYMRAHARTHNAYTQWIYILDLWSIRVP